MRTLGSRLRWEGRRRTLFSFLMLSVSTMLS